MFATLAAIVFAVGLFGGHIFGLNLVYLGFTFVAIHLALGGGPLIPVSWRRRLRA